MREKRVIMHGEQVPELPWRYAELSGALRCFARFGGTRENVFAQGFAINLKNTKDD